MKNNKYSKIKVLYLLMVSALTLSVTSCDLEAQDAFEYVRETPAIPINSATAFDWIESNAREDTLFTSLNSAIALLDMEDEYRASGRTFFLLTNDAWNTNDFDNSIWGILQNLGGPALSALTVPEIQQSEAPFDLISGSDAVAERDLLRRILLYHIIDQNVEELSLVDWDTQQIFQTLLPGFSGQMAIHRDGQQWELRINNNLESGFTNLAPRIGTLPVNVQTHNILFENGRSHYVNRASRWGENWDENFNPLQ